MATSKFPEEQRTFETRVKFIRDIFSSKYTPDQIMASCVNYRLDMNLKKLIKDIHKQLWKLSDEDPMDILKRID